MQNGRFFVGLAVLLVALGPARAAQLTDDRGHAVTIPAKPSRIAALSPHLAEIVHAAGAGAQLAAVVRYSDYPEAALRVPQVGDASRIDIERILSLKPDLVLAWKSGNPAHDLLRIERLGFPVFVTEPRRLTDIARLVRTVGSLAGTESVAETAASRVERELETLRRRYGARPIVRVFYEIWHRPLLTVNGEHIISDVIALCGGLNVFARAPVLTPAVSLEAVLAARPHVILGGSSAGAPGNLERDWAHAPIGALRELPTRYVTPDLIQRQTPRIVAGARMICEQLDEIRSLSTSGSFPAATGRRHRPRDDSARVQRRTGDRTAG
jgi:iron complex transport system substrate-binding protein